MQAGGSALAQILLLAITPVLTRLYNEEEFGSFELYAAIVTMAAVLATGRLFEAIVIPAQHEDGYDVFRAGRNILGGYAAVAFVVVALFRTQIANLFTAPGLETILWFAPIGILALGARQLYQGWATRSRNYGALAETNIARAIGSSVASLGAGFLGFGAGGLVAGHSAGFAAASLRLGQKLKVEATPRRKSFSEVVREHKKFPLLSGPSALLNAASRSLPAFSLALLFGGTAALGFYALVVRALGQPLLLFQESSARVYSGEAADLRRTGSPGMRQLFSRFARAQAGIGLAIVGTAFVLAPTLFPIVFGDNWADAADYLRVLAPLFFFRTIASPMMATFFILDRQGTYLAVELTKFGTVALAFVLAARLDLEILPTLGLFAGIASIGQIVAGLAVWYEARRWDQAPIAPVANDDGTVAP